MPNYAYTVLNKSGGKLTGTIEADDMGKAREDLNKLGFSVVSIDKAPDSEVESQGVKSFEFEAIDTSGKKVEGTIKAKKRIDAYKKLKLEYNLEIRYIVDSNLSESQKGQEKLKGTTDLELKLREESKKEETKEMKEEEKFMQAKLTKEEELKKKVAFIIEKIDKFVQEYRGVINPQKFADISQEKDKLMRIKSSKNIEHIKDTTENLLRMLQQEELFMKGKVTEEKKAHLQVEAKRIMEELNIKNTTNVSTHELAAKLKGWEEEHYGGRETDLKFYEKFIKEIADFIIRIFENDPRVVELKQKISTANRQIVKYIKLYIQEKSKEGKTDIKQSVKTIFKEKKKLKAELAGLKSKIKQEHKTTLKNTFEDDADESSLLDHITSFSGWLLFFYVIYYFISIYITTKDFGLSAVPQGFYIYNSISFKYIIVLVFLIHCVFSLKKNLFKHSTAASILIFPLFTAAGILILFNL